MPNFVAEIPVWKDFPFKIPPHVEVRRRTEGDNVILWDRNKEVNVTLTSDFLNQSNVDLAVNMLEWL